MREQCSAGAAAQRVCERDGSVESEPLRYVPTRRLPTSRSLPTARCLFRETAKTRSHRMADSAGVRRPARRRCVEKAVTGVGNLRCAVENDP